MIKKYEILLVDGNTMPVELDEELVEAVRKWSGAPVYDIRFALANLKKYYQLKRYETEMFNDL